MARAVMTRLVPLVVMIVCMLSVAAQGDDRQADQVIRLRVGEQRTLSFGGLIRFSVSDTNVLIVRHLKGDAVVVEGIAPGDTWVEVVHGARAFTAVRVIVEGSTVATSPSPRVTGPSPSSAPGPAPSTSAFPSFTPTPSPSSTASPSSTPAPSPSSTASPLPASLPSTSPTSTASPGPNERRLATDGQALRIGIEFDYGVDTQTVTTLIALLDGAGHLALASSDVRVQRQFQVVPVTFDWSVSPRDRLTAVLPYINMSQHASGVALSSSGSGLGDIQLSYEHMFGRRAVNGWDTGVSVSASLPTGRSVYDHLADNQLALGTGHFEVGSNFIVRRLADPLAVYAALGLEYTVPRGFNGTTVAPGLGWNAVTGISYALSDHWAVSEALTYVRRPNVFQATPTAGVTQNVDQAYITHAFNFSSRRGDFLLRLMLSAGLNEASTDFVGGVSATWKH